jgi:hypothetical protein
MASRGQTITLSYYAYDTGNSVGKTGDVANHTLRLTKDGGTPTAPTNAAAEVDATNMPGWYQVVLTGTECTANTLVLGGKSSTAGIIISGQQVTLEQLPTAAPAASGGLPTFGTGAGQINPDGSGNVPIKLSQTGLTVRALDSVADSALTVGDALVAAACGTAGKEAVSGTSYVVKTPSTGTVIRTFTLDSSTAPTSRN